MTETPSIPTDITKMTVSELKAYEKLLRAELQAARERERTERSRKKYPKMEFDSVDDLIKEGWRRFHAPYAPIDFETGKPEAERLLNDLDKYPHIYVLGCIINRQMDSWRAFLAPFSVGSAIGGWEFTDFQKITPEQMFDLFVSGKLGRFNEKFAASFCSAITLIERKYEGNASLIWEKIRKAPLLFGGSLNLMV